MGEGRKKDKRRKRRKKKKKKGCSEERKRGREEGRDRGREGETEKEKTERKEIAGEQGRLQRDGSVAVGVSEIIKGEMKALPLWKVQVKAR